MNPYLLEHESLSALPYFLSTILNNNRNLMLYAGFDVTKCNRILMSKSHTSILYAMITLDDCTMRVISY